MSRRSQIVHSPPAPVADAVTRLGRNIRTARQNRGLTQAQLAEQVGISRSTLVYLEHGKPGAAIAIYLTVVSALGLLDSVNEIADPDSDLRGAGLDLARLPGRGRAPGDR